MKKQMIALISLFFFTMISSSALADGRVQLRFLYDGNECEAKRSPVFDDSVKEVSLGTFEPTMRDYCKFEFPPKEFREDIGVCYLTTFTPRFKVNKYDRPGVRYLPSEGAMVFETQSMSEVRYICEK